MANVSSYADWIWTALAIAWAASALRTKRTTRRQSSVSRAVHIVILTLSFALLFPSLRLLDRIPVGPLGGRFVPDTAAVAWLGVALTLAGCALAVWARLILGSNWSASVTVKRDHQLIRGGPYSVVRHPIYSGLLLAMLGTALAVGQWRGLAGFALACIAWVTKLRMEEVFMTGQFGAAYISYRRQVKALIPFVF